LNTDFGINNKRQACNTGTVSGGHMVDEFPVHKGNRIMAPLVIA
jgi:hypothetical protein